MYSLNIKLILFCLDWYHLVLCDSLRWTSELPHHFLNLLDQLSILKLLLTEWVLVRLLVVKRLNHEFILVVISWLG
jgi:hypothetical protein